MDNYTFVPDAPIKHSVEVYTSRFLVHGTISGPYRRTSDLLNRKDDSFIAVENVAISPVGQGVEPQRLATPLMLGRHSIHFAALPLPQLDQTEGEQEGVSQSQLPKEYSVTKRTHPCYVLTDTYIIHGRCHILEGADLRNLLEGGQIFIPITEPVIHLAARISVTPWKRDLVIVNREKIEVMYLVPEGTASPAGQNDSPDG